MRETAGGAVQRAFEDAEPGGDGRVGVRAGGRGDAYGEGRGGQVVVDEQAECRVQGAQGGLVGDPDGEPGPEAVGQWAFVAVVVASVAAGRRRGWG